MLYKQAMEERPEKNWCSCTLIGEKLEGFSVNSLPSDPERSDFQIPRLALF